ncbi:carcinoembryonic antigen-related cell adhesion molecule 5-like, partial [Clarias magur]
NPKPELTSNLIGDALTGNSVTLYCRVKLQFDGSKFYWIKSTQSTETETIAYYTNYDYDHSSKSYYYPPYSYYEIRSVSVSDGGLYRCRAGRGNPVYYTQYSDELSLNVI